MSGIYCSNCGELRPGSTDGLCPECGGRLGDEPLETKPMATRAELTDPFTFGRGSDDPSDPAESPAEERGIDDLDLRPGSSAPPRALPPVPAEAFSARRDPISRSSNDTDTDDAADTGEEATPGEQTGGTDEVGRLFREGTVVTTPPPRPEPTAPQDAAGPAPPASEDEDQVAREIRQFVQQGYQPFGFIGFPASGKTHFLKALATLLGTHGLVSEKAGRLDEELLPGVSKAQVYSYDFASRYGKWLFLDAGGELYLGLRDNNWSRQAEEKLELTRWLHRCRGLFLFLHLTRAHVDRREMHRSRPSRDRRDPASAEEMAERAKAAQTEILFLGQVLLFLRAIRAENGNVSRIVEKCRGAASLEEALREYRSAPRLDIPVMLFLTKADSYDKGFEIADGIQFFPRRMAGSPMTFAARFLPRLFGPLMEHTRRFKIDFLQSYVEFPLKDESGRPVIEDGKPVIEVEWEARPNIPLSVGLTEALEFVLRHPPNDGGVNPWWRDLLHGHGLDTRRSLLLHRRLHPEQWEGVKVDLGSFWSEGA